MAGFRALNDSFWIRVEPDLYARHRISDGFQFRTSPAALGEPIASLGPDSFLSAAADRQPDMATVLEDHGFAIG